MNPFLLGDTDHLFRFLAGWLAIGLKFRRHLTRMQIEEFGPAGIADGRHRGGIGLDETSAPDDPDRLRHLIEQVMKALLAAAVFDFFIQATPRPQIALPCMQGVAQQTQQNQHTRQGSGQQAFFRQGFNLPDLQRVDRQQFALGERLIGFNLVPVMMDANPAQQQDGKSQRQDALHAGGPALVSMQAMENRER